jgi:peptidoglycan/LPS O-acetylase OafA/YrhL
MPIRISAPRPGLMADRLTYPAAPGFAIDAPQRRDWRVPPKRGYIAPTNGGLGLVLTIARDNLDALTGLRFVAAFTIAFGHASAAWLPVTAIGMPLFFTLSGFIIHYVYGDAFAAQPRRAAGEFAIARFSRIYPLYAFLLGYQLFFTPMGPPLAHLSQLPLLLAYLSASWTWFPYMIDGGMAGDWFYAISWSVPTEIFFYICYALFLYRIAGLRSIRICLIALIGFCVFAYLYFYTLFLTRDAWEPALLSHFPQYVARTTDFNQSLYRWFLYHSPYSRILEFIAGVLTCQLFRLVRREGIALRHLHPGAIAAAGFVVLAFLFPAFGYLGEANPWLAAGNHSLGAFLVTLHMNFLFAPACCLLIFSLALGGTALARVLASRPCRYLGDISYSTYLSHPLAPRILMHAGVTLSSSVAYVVVLFALIYAMSTVLYAVVELPAKRWLRRMLDARLQTSAALSRGAAP